ncbi:MAG: cytochrome c1 [Gammaproteobacteria bacterium AqS3]|nr:cytochrome c1 [Gammaproteobacteria bacterium AqS3]
MMRAGLLLLLAALTQLGALSVHAAVSAPCGTWKGTGECEDVSFDMSDRASLQRGAALFMNYCLGCHTTRYARYERFAEDVGVDIDLLKEHLIFDGSQPGSLIVNGMKVADAKKWFGAPPPDLSLITRARSPQWLYTYLLAFYRDETRPLGHNNRVFPNVGMPHVLEELQGVQRQVCAPVRTYAENGGVRRDPLTRELITEESCDVLQVDAGTGMMGETEYRQAAYDLANYLHYTAEPYRSQRISVGIYVVFYLLLLIVILWMLNREFQKDVADKH